MIRITLLLIFSSAVFAQTIDKTVFKNCSRIEFCTRLRNNNLQDSSKYTADIASFTNENDIVRVPLTNKESNKLFLVIYLLEGNKVRVKIQEADRKRFELDEIVIVEDLKILPIGTPNVDNKSLSISPEDKSYPYKVVVVAGPPFAVEVYFKEDLSVVLDGDKILMENTNESQAFTFNVTFPGSTRLYGLPDHAYRMSLGTTNNGSENSMDPFRLRNSDSWAYEANSPMALYGARPVIFGHSKRKTSAIFLLNAAEQWIDAISGENVENPSAYFMVERAAFDLFVFLGPTTPEIVRQFTTLTGKAHLPQIWALGYHQSRFSYKSQEDVKDVVALMGKHDFPFDVIYLDGDHTDDYRWFRWNHTTYSDPVEMQKNISAAGRLCVSISDPHIKVEDSYDVYAGAKDHYFTKWANGSNYEADCWPGLSSWIDFMIPEASDYYGSWYSYEKFVNTTPTLAGIWNDMNEPAVFDDSTEKTMNYTVLHNGTVPHGDIHNLYGFMQTRSTHKGLYLRDNGEKRPFILTRSHFAGSQRFAAMWTGDNSATWDHFANSYSQCMTANLMGMVFCGADIGGFIGNPSDELLQRWYQGAVWTTFFRGHSSRESKRREPYLFSDDVQNVLRNALRLRYKHIPSFYTLFFEHTRTGDPIIRPLYYQYPDVEDVDTQVLVGTDIMGVAVTKPNVTAVEVLFPGKSNEDHWYRMDDEYFDIFNAGTTQNVSVTIATSPVFYKAGSIVFRKDTPRKTAVAAMNDHYTLYINVDATGQANGRLYLDDYFSFNYDELNNYLYVDVTFHLEHSQLDIKLIDGDSKGFDTVFETLVVHTIHNDDRGNLLTKQAIYKNTSDDIPLSKINIGESLRKDESNKICMKFKKM